MLRGRGQQTVSLKIIVIIITRTVLVIPIKTKRPGSMGMHVNSHTPSSLREIPKSRTKSADPHRSSRDLN